MQTHATSSPQLSTNKEAKQPSNDPHHDLMEALMLLHEQIRHLRKEKSATPQTLSAIDYLYSRLLNFQAMMRTRTLEDAYEFMCPPDGTWGWYYKGAGIEANDPFSWHGPFSSRKEAVAAKLDRPFVPKNRLRFLETQLGLTTNEPTK